MYFDPCMAARIAERGLDTFRRAGGAIEQSGDLAVTRTVGSLSRRCKVSGNSKPLMLHCRRKPLDGETE